MKCAFCGGELSTKGHAQVTLPNGDIHPVHTVCKPIAEQSIVQHEKKVDQLKRISHEAMRDQQLQEAERRRVINNLRRRT